MITLEEAVEMANSRKESAMGESVAGVMFTASKEIDRAIFSGFDVDTDEVHVYSDGLADYILRAMVAASIMGDSSVSPTESFKATWVDGFLVGLIMGKENAR